MNNDHRLASFLGRFIYPKSISSKPRHQLAGLLTWILLFLFLFSIATLIIILIFNPHHDPSQYQYTMLIGGLMVFCTVALFLNFKGFFYAAAALLIALAAVTPWVSLLFDPSILQGDIIPLTYVTFSVLLSGIFLPTFVTLPLALMQFAGILFVLGFSPVDVNLNWFSLLTFVFLTSVFSLLANGIIQRDTKQIAEKTKQLEANEILLREQSIRDYLTNLFNRRYLEETLTREIKRVGRKQVPLSIIMLDVDQFKNINDSLGHVTGDTILRELGKFLASQVRQSDIACRYGGDEFVLVLPDASQETAVKRAEQLRIGVTNLSLPTGITVSLGVAICPNQSTEGETLLKYADAAMYEAKHSGGNRLVIAEIVQNMDPNYL